MPRNKRLIQRELRKVAALTRAGQIHRKFVKRIGLRQHYNGEARFGFPKPLCSENQTHLHRNSPFRGWIFKLLPIRDALSGPRQGLYANSQLRSLTKLKRVFDFSLERSGTKFHTRRKDIEMVTASGTKQQTEFESLQGGKLPQSDVERHLTDLRTKLDAEAKERALLRQEAAKYFSEMEPPARADDAKATHAIEGLRGITERLAQQRLVAPRKVIVPPITAWGTYTLKFTPWYWYMGTYSVGTISSVTGNPTISATGVDTLGQLSCSVSTNF